MHIPQGITEQELIRQCQKGDLKYQELLYKQFYGYAMGVGLRYCNNRNDALEVVNDAFIKAFKNFSGYRPAQPFKAWFRKIIINTAIDQKRREQKHLWHADIDDAEHLPVEAGAASTLSLADILSFLNQLQPLHRLVFNLYEIDGYSHDEIAQKLNIAASSSRVYLTRAKEKLRMLINMEEKHL